MFNSEMKKFAFDGKVKNVFNCCVYDGFVYNADVLVESEKSSLILFDDDLIIPENSVGNDVTITIYIFIRTTPEIIENVNPYYRMNENKENEIVGIIDNEIEEFYRIRVENQFFYIHKDDFTNSDQCVVLSDIVRFKNPRLDVCFASWPRKVNGES